MRVRRPARVRGGSSRLRLCSQGPESDEESDDGVILATTHGIFRHNRMVLPSKTFGTRVVAIARRLAGPLSPEHPPWTPDDVQQAINDADSWLGVVIDTSSVDAALYMALPSHAEPQAGDWVRFFWTPSGSWITARVTGFSMNQGVNRSVSVFIPEEESSAILSGPDALYIYKLFASETPRRKRSRVIDNED